MRILVCANCRSRFPDKWRKRPQCCCRKCAVELKARPLDRRGRCRFDGCTANPSSFYGYCRRHQGTMNARKYYVRGSTETTSELEDQIIHMFELQFKTRRAIAMELGLDEKKVRSVVARRTPADPSLTLH